MTNHEDILTNSPEKLQHASAEARQKLGDTHGQSPQTVSDTDETNPAEQKPSSFSGKKRGNEAQVRPEYVTGVKLFALLVTVTLVVFLLLLDLSIISTVSDPVRHTVLGPKAGSHGRSGF